MSKNADEKRNKILETAKKRFAHYGLAKTTMAEIAKDLAFSKALLYYYFPDKNSLYMAVIEDVVNEIDEETRETINADTKVDEAINLFLEKRLACVRKYFYIIEYTLLMRKEVTNEIDKFLFESFDKQKEIIKIIFEQGVARKELREMDIDEKANIFLNACLGMRMVVMKDLSSFFVLDKEQFNTILELEKKLAHIFITGLKA